MVSIRAEALLGVVDGHAAVDSVGQGRVLHDGHPLVGTIGMLKEHDGRPVVGKVLGEGAGRAGALLADITCHGGVEGIAADDLVEMGRGDLAGFDEGVETLDGEGRAAEPEGGFGADREGQGEGEPLHD